MNNYLTIEELEESKTPIYITSKSDTKDASLSEEDLYLLPASENQIVYNLDQVAELIGKKYRKSKPTKSADAFYVSISSEEYFLIEFKNTCKNHVPKNELFVKAYDSMFLIQLILNGKWSFEDLRKRLTYIVVYNNHAKQKETSYIQDSPSIINFADTLGKLAQENFRDVNKVHFNLDVYKEVFFKKIYTVDKVDFIEILEPMIFKGK